jgi:hypothetical protein
MLSQIELPQNTATHAPQLDVLVVLCAQGLQEQEAQCGNQISLWGKNILISVFEVNDFFLTSFKNSRKGNNRKRLGLEEDSEVIELKP